MLLTYTAGNTVLRYFVKVHLGSTLSVKIVFVSMLVSSGVLSAMVNLQMNWNSFQLDTNLTIIYYWIESEK